MTNPVTGSATLPPINFDVLAFAGASAVDLKQGVPLNNDDHQGTLRRLKDFADAQGVPAAIEALKASYQHFGLSSDAASAAASTTIENAGLAPTSWLDTIDFNVLAFAGASAIDLKQGVPLNNDDHQGTLRRLKDFAEEHGLPAATDALKASYQHFGLSSDAAEAATSTTIQNAGLAPTSWLDAIDFNVLAFAGASAVDLQQGVPLNNDDHQGTLRRLKDFAEEHGLPAATDALKASYQHFGLSSEAAEAATAATLANNGLEA